MTMDERVSRAGRDGVPVTPGHPRSEDRGMANPVRELGLVRVAFAALAWLFVLSLIVQVLLVGLEIFADMGGSIHRDFAYVYGWLAPVLVLLSRMPAAPVAARIPTLLLLLLFAAQTVLPSLKDDLPVLAAFHTVNALAIFALAIVVARRATAGILPGAGAAS